MALCALLPFCQAQIKVTQKVYCDDIFKDVINIFLQVFISAALMEYYCSKVSQLIYFEIILICTFTLMINYIIQLISESSSELNTLSFQDKAVAFKIFELGLKVHLIKYIVLVVTWPVLCYVYFVSY